jgi:predicted DCC family thiol-disulfide oxidoreductase YuxK
MATHLPVLVFDGECGFCRYWIARWRARTGPAVTYLPFQDPSVAAALPDIPRDEFARSVQFVDEHGAVSAGARAVFLLTERAGAGWPLWSYEHVPGVSALTEWAYRLQDFHVAVPSPPRPLVRLCIRFARGSGPGLNRT